VQHEGWQPIPEIDPQKVGNPGVGVLARSVDQILAPVAAGDDLTEQDRIADRHGLPATAGAAKHHQIGDEQVVPRDDVDMPESAYRRASAASVCG
jgi:hypothetical protein